MIDFSQFTPEELETMSKGKLPDTITPAAPEVDFSQFTENELAHMARGQMPIDEPIKEGPASAKELGLRAIDEMQIPLYGAVRGAGNLFGSDWLEQAGKEGVERNIREAEEDVASERLKKWEDVNDLPSLGRFLYEQGIINSPAIATDVAATLVGGVFPGGQFLLPAAVSFPQYYGGNINRQIAEQGEINSQLGAIGAALGQSALEGVTPLVPVKPFLKGFSTATLKAAESPALKAGMEAANTALGKRAAINNALEKSLLTRVPYNVLKRGTMEGLEEVGQSGLERLQAGLSITDQSAMDEFKQSFVVGAGLGGFYGGIHSTLGPNIDIRDPEIQNKLAALRRRVDDEEMQKHIAALYESGNETEARNIEGAILQLRDMTGGSVENLNAMPNEVPIGMPSRPPIATRTEGATITMPTGEDAVAFVTDNAASLPKAAAIVGSNLSPELKAAALRSYARSKQFADDWQAMQGPATPLNRPVITGGPEDLSGLVPEIFGAQSPLDDMGSRQILEWAKQNAGRVPGLREIVDARIPNAQKFQIIERYVNLLREQQQALQDANRTNTLVSEQGGVGVGTPAEVNAIQAERQRRLDEATQPSQTAGQTFIEAEKFRQKEPEPTGVEATVQAATQARKEQTAPFAERAQRFSALRAAVEAMPHGEVPAMPYVQDALGGASVQEARRALEGLVGQYGPLRKVKGQYVRYIPQAASPLTQLGPEVQSTFAKQQEDALTPLGRKIVDAVAKGGTPSFMSNNIRQAARENGIEIAPTDTPAAVVQRLAEKGAGIEARGPVQGERGPEATALPVRKPKRPRKGGQFAKPEAATEAGPENIRRPAGEASALGVEPQAEEAAAPQGPRPVRLQASPRGIEADAARRAAEEERANEAPEVKAAREARAEEARKKIKEVLEEMKKRGPAGRIAARAFEEVLKDSRFGAVEAYHAYLMSDIISTIFAGTNAKPNISFVKGLVEGENAAMRYEPTPGLNGLIEMSLSPRAFKFARENAAHEAFHALQDMIAEYDPKSASVLFGKRVGTDADGRGIYEGGAFRDGMRLSDLDPSVANFLKRHAPDEGGESYYDRLQAAFDDMEKEGRTDFMSQREMMAHVFGALSDARLRGIQLEGTLPLYKRIANGLAEFRRRMGNFLRGQGYASARDVLQDYAHGRRQKGYGAEPILKKTTAATGEASGLLGDNKGLVEEAKRLGIDPSNLTEMRKLREMRAVNKKFRGDMNEALSDRHELLVKLRDEGKLPLEIGTRILTPKAKETGSPPWRIIGYAVNPNDPDTYGYKVERIFVEDGETVPEKTSLYVNYSKDYVAKARKNGVLVRDPAAEAKKWKVLGGPLRLKGEASGLLGEEPKDFSSVENLMEEVGRELDSGTADIQLPSAPGSISPYKSIRIIVKKDEKDNNKISIVAGGMKPDGVGGYKDSNTYLSGVSKDGGKIWNMKRHYGDYEETVEASGVRLAEYIKSVINPEYKPDSKGVLYPLDFDEPVSPEKFFSKVEFPHYEQEWNVVLGRLTSAGTGKASKGSIEALYNASKNKWNVNLIDKNGDPHFITEINGGTFIPEIHKYIEDFATSAFYQIGTDSVVKYSNGSVEHIPISLFYSMDEMANPEDLAIDPDLQDVYDDLEGLGEFVADDFGAEMSVKPSVKTSAEPIALTEPVIAFDDGLTVEILKDKGWLLDKKLDITKDDIAYAVNNYGSIGGGLSEIYGTSDIVVLFDKKGNATLFFGKPENAAPTDNIVDLLNEGKTYVQKRIDDGYSKFAEVHLVQHSDGSITAMPYGESEFSIPQFALRMSQRPDGKWQIVNADDENQTMPFEASKAQAVNYLLYKINPSYKLTPTGKLQQVVLPLHHYPPKKSVYAHSYEPQSPYKDVEFPENLQSPGNVAISGVKKNGKITNPLYVAMITNQRKHQWAIYSIKPAPGGTEKLEEFMPDFGLASLKEIKKALTDIVNPTYFSITDGPNLKVQDGKLINVSKEEIDAAMSAVPPDPYEFNYATDKNYIRLREAGVRKAPIAETETPPPISNEFFQNKFDDRDMSKEEMRQWFRKSKIIDKDGSPIVFYRGTGSEPSDVMRGEMIFSSPSPRFANNFAQGRHARLQPVYVRAENPFDYENPDHVKMVDLEIRKRSGSSEFARSLERAAQGNYDNWRTIENKQALIRSLGFDAAFVKENNTKNIFVYDPNQYKSIFNEFVPGAAASPQFSALLSPEGEELPVRKVNKTPEQLDNDIEGLSKRLANIQAAGTRRLFSIEKITRPIFDKLVRFTDPKGKMNYRDAYRMRLYKAIGDIRIIERRAKELYDRLDKATPEQRKLIYDYLTTKGASVPSVPKPLRDAAIEAKQDIIAIGRELVAKHLLKKETVEEKEGGYLPRLYMKFVLENPTFGTGSMRRSGRRWDKELNKDLDEELRKAYGEIKDPAFATMVAQVFPRRDMVILDFLKGIAEATNTDWVLPKTIVDWRGLKVTPYWLANEAADIRKRMGAEPDEKTRKEMGEIANQMQTIADHYGLEGEIPSDYMQLPNSARYGLLRGMVVRREIYNDLVGMGTYSGDMDSFQKIFGDQNSLISKGVQYWKLSKTVYNLPAHVRQFFSNGVLLHLSGVPLPLVPKRVLEAVNAMRNNDRYWQVAEQYGIASTGMVDQELRGALDQIRATVEKMGDGPFNLPLLRKMMSGLALGPAKLYQLNDTLFKVAKIIDVMKAQERKLGGLKANDTEGRALREGAAALEAHKWFMDYADVHSWIKSARNAPLGMPFITYQYKIAPLLAEVMLKQPWRFLPYVSLYFALPALAAAGLGLSDDEVEKAKKAAKEFIRNNPGALPLPVLDANKNFQFVDVSYLFPWSYFSGIANTLGNAAKGDASVSDVLKAASVFSSPVLTTPTALMTNTDTFTGEKISNEFDTPDQKFSAWLGYIWGQIAPPIITNYGAIGKPVGDWMFGNGEMVDRKGNPKETTAQLFARAVGFNIYPVDPVVQRAQVMSRMNYEINQIKARMTYSLRDRRLTQQQREELRKDYVDQIRKRVKEMQDYARETQLTPAMRKN